MTQTWYTSSTAEDTQGLIYNEKTGQNIAVCYQVENARLIAAAPELLEACKLAFLHLQICNDCEPEAANHGAEAMRAILEAMQKATAETYNSNRDREPSEYSNDDPEAYSDADPGL
jgi:hypothetical protein